MNLDELLAKWNGGKMRGAPRKFARALKVSETYFSSLRSGRNAPGEDVIARSAELLKISADEARQLFPSKPPSGVDMGTLTEIDTIVPVLGAVSADRFAFSFDAVPDEHIPNPWPRKKVFALRISGDCMEPTFRDGEYVYLSETTPPTNGRVVLAQFDGEFTLKRYFKHADGIELRPDNTKYKPIRTTSNKLLIRGVVVGTYRKDI